MGRSKTKLKAGAFLFAIILLIIAAALSPFDNPFTSWLGQTFTGGDEGAAVGLQLIIIAAMILLAAAILIGLGYDFLGRLTTMYVGDPKDIRRGARRSGVSSKWEWLLVLFGGFLIIDALLLHWINFDYPSWLEWIDPYMSHAYWGIAFVIIGFALIWRKNKWR